MASSVVSDGDTSKPEDDNLVDVSLLKELARRSLVDALNAVHNFHPPEILAVSSIHPGSWREDVGIGSRISWTPRIGDRGLFAEAAWSR